MKEKILRWSIYLLGIFCLYVFISIRFLPVMNTLIADKIDPESQDFSEYGDLYYFNCISHFREKYPKKVRKYRFSEKHPAINNAEILTFGDSFFDFPFHVSLPERLGDTLKQRVFCNVTYDPTRANPFCVLDQSGYQRNEKSKYLIYETTERNIPARFSTPYNKSCPAEEINTTKKITNFIDRYIFKRNSEALNDVLLKNSYFTKKTYSAISTFKFDLYGYITVRTPLYKTGQPPWLFYEKDVSDKPGGFYYQYSEEEIQNFSENIQLLAKNLKEVYNLEMIFYPIPNKYTLYHTVLNNDPYNNLLPRLYKELDKRYVKYVNLYQPYVSSNELLYWGTDTHWNKKGIDIALNKTVDEINKINTEKN